MGVDLNQLKFKWAALGGRAQPAGGPFDCSGFSDFSNPKMQWNQGPLINYQCAGRPAGSGWCKSTAMKE